MDFLNLGALLESVLSNEDKAKDSGTSSSDGSSVDPEDFLRKWDQFQERTAQEEPITEDSSPPPPCRRKSEGGRSSASTESSGASDGSSSPQREKPSTSRGLLKSVRLVERPAGFIAPRFSQAKDREEGTCKCDSALRAEELDKSLRSFSADFADVIGPNHSFVQTIISLKSESRLDSNDSGVLDCEEEEHEVSLARDCETEDVEAIESPPLSSSSTRDPCNKKKQHIRWFGHGKYQTTLALCFAWLGCIFAIVSRLSTHFVDLEKPLVIGPLYQPVTKIGVIRMTVCYNETVSKMSGCDTIRISPEEVDDNMFNLSRSLLFLGTALGVGLTLVLCTSTFWESINLRPVGMGFILAYFFQSFAMLFFDTKICNKYRCTVSKGAILCILASFCWVASCVLVAKMETFKIKAERARVRAERKRRKEERRARNQAAMKRKQSTTSLTTDEESSEGAGRLAHEDASQELHLASPPPSEVEEPELQLATPVSEH